MPRMRKTLRPGRTRPTPKSAARRTPAVEDADLEQSELAGLAEEHRASLGTVTDGQHAAELPPEQSADATAEEDGRGDLRPPVEEARASSAGEGAGPEAAVPPVMDAAALLGMVDFLRGALVTVLAQVNRVSGPEVDRLKKIDPATMEWLRTFAPAAAKYLPWMNAHADLIGCVCFFGLVGLDTSQAIKALSRLKREAAKREQSSEAAFGPRSTPGATVILGGDVASPAG